MVGHFLFARPCTGAQVCDATRLPAALKPGQQLIPEMAENGCQLMFEVSAVYNKIQEPMLK